jgi:hypothetical protein
VQIGNSTPRISATQVRISGTLEVNDSCVNNSRSY